MDQEVGGGEENPLEVRKKIKKILHLNYPSSDEGKLEQLLSLRLYLNSFCLQRPGLRDVMYIA